MKEIQILNNGDTLNAIRTKINENFQLTREEIENGTTDPLAKFGVNEGNETDGVADLLNIEEGTLSFKVGGEYPNLVTTSGDGVTTQIESINPLHLQNLADGEYTVVVNGSNSNITDAEFYSQLLEPENVNEGDVWFNGESAYEKKNSQPMLEELASTGLTLNTLTKLDNYYLAISSNNTLYTSEDDGVTWTPRTISSSGNGAYVGCVAFKNAFFLLTTDRQLFRINKAWQLERITSIYNGDSVVPTKLLVQNDILFAFAGGNSIYYTTTNENYWTATGIPEATIPRDIVFVDDKYYLFDNSGRIFTSTNLTDWTATQHIIQTPSCAKLYGDNILIGCTNGYLLVFNLESDTIRQITPLKQGATITDIDILPDGGVLIVGHQGLCAVSYDLQNFTQLLQRDNLITATEGNFIVGSSGIHCKLVAQSTWIPYPYIPVGEVTISGGEVTYFTTYPYNTNGLHEASSSSFGLLRTAAVVDELNCHCEDAVITPANLYSLNNYRTMNTEYQVDEKVGCPYHHNLQLKCIQAGVTSNEGLNTRGPLEASTTIEDGTVIWEVEELGTGGGGKGSGFDLFDTKISDHILTDKELEGWALQGTYVYKNGGTDRVGYPDFYNTCLEEYQNSEIQLLTVPWTQPIATGATTAIDGGDMVITANGDNYNTIQTPLNGDHSSTGSTNYWKAGSGTGSAWWQVKFPYKIKITALTFYNGSASDFVTKGRFYTSSEMTTPIGDEFSPAQSNLAKYEIQNIPSEGIITDTIYFYQIAGVNGGGVSEITITAEKVIGEVSKNNNGHRFYPISQKSAIDEIYNQYGIADFYGIDEENERIFLPRNKHFFQLTDDPTKVNEIMTAGLPNIEAGFQGETRLGTLTGAFTTVGVVQGDGGWTGPGTNPDKFRMDASLSNPIYGNSDTVQPPSSLKLLYYCVGNTQVTSAVTDVTEITTSENDTLPWGYNFYSGDLLEAPVGYVQSQGQWNGGNEWQSFYDRAVAKIGQPFADGYIKNHTEEYDDFDLVINQDEMTFRLPLLNGEENIVSDKYEDWELKPSVSNYTAPANGMIQLTKRAGTADAYITMWSDLNGQQLNNSCPTSGGSVSATMELTKGETFNVGYSASGDTVRFRFIYFKGNGNLYFKLANAVQNLELLNVGEVMDGLAQKADTNLDNANPSQNFKEQSITWGIPDYTAGVSRTANVEYIAECAGYISGYISGKNKTLDIYINGNKIIHTGGGGTDIVMYHAQAFVDKGDTYKLTDADYTFYPLKGAK